MSRLRRCARIGGIAMACALALGAGLRSGRGQELPDYKNTSLPFEKRVADLIKRMTLDEKAAQTQMYVPRNTRLDIEAVHWWTEGIHGIARAGRATIFPQAIAMSASWNVDLMHKVAIATADEARAKYMPPVAGNERYAYHGIMVWAPTLNMAREPRWGRIEETFGEDPYLTAKLGVTFIKGLQGEDPKYLKTVATPKHFVMHSQETQRHSRSFDVSERTLREYYLPAFEASIREGGATSIMTAYNGINGVPCTVNSWLLTDLLRGEWRFDGTVVSDFLAPQHLVQSHHYSSTYVDAAADALNAGCDVLCDPRNMAPDVATAVRSGQLSEAILDRALTRNLMLRFRLGFFDPPEMVPFAKMPADTVGKKEHIQLALQMARESMVLLQNNPAPSGYGFGKLLPLDLRRISSIAVIGPYSNTMQFGAYSPNSPGGVAMSPLAAIKAAVGDRVTVKGANYYDVEGSVRAAAEADVAIVVVGLNPQVEDEGIDRYSLDLQRDQTSFLEKVVKANPLTIVVLEGGGPIGCAWMKERVPAILMTWYPGEQGGNALAEILLGQTNPSGRLPVTFYRHIEDLPRMDDYEISHGRTYMYVTKPPCFVFGHGLSYTTFSYANLKAAAPAATGPATGPADEEIPAPGGGIRFEFSVDIKNTGDRDGDEVVQLYVRKLQSAVSRPIKQLKGFKRITLKAGETRNVQFTLPASDLTYWDEKTKKYAVESGTYELMMGSSSEDIRLKAEFSVK